MGELRTYHIIRDIKNVRNVYKNILLFTNYCIAYIIKV
ncbi:hypothetical protein CBC_A1093 [Clostridium botulinum C str. Eklund]|nr:hypothetical protein CBC_A1093 [Clostridium botulinum C str. Eklund]